MWKSPQSHDITERRTFWASQLEAAHAFMDQVMEYPIDECGEPVVSLEQAADAAGVMVVFSTTKIAGSLDRKFYLREGLISGFVSVARAMNDRGWTLKVEDGFRTRHMQRELSLAPYVIDVILRKVIWELDGAFPEPDFLFRRLRVLTATAPKIGTHMSASAIDISVLGPDHTGEIDRGGPYLEMSEKTPMFSPFISPEASRNRETITAVLSEQGFVAYPYEFWHYNRDDAYHRILGLSGKPARYGAVDVDERTGRVTPIPNPTESLHTDETFRAAMQEAIDRLQK